MSAGSNFLKFPTTLPEELTRAGYHTGVIGHMGQSPAQTLYGFSQGTISADYEKWLELHSGGLYSYRGHTASAPIAGWPDRVICRSISTYLLGHLRGYPLY